MKALIGLLIGTVISLALASFAGENPIHVLTILAKSAFGSPYDLGLALFYTTSLIFTGLSVAIAFHAGLFNIGAEGQLTIGALVATWFGVSHPNLPEALAPFLISIVGISAAAVWGFIPGWLKAFRGSHEVIVTMMLNFIAAGIASFVTLEMIKNPETQNPESSLLPADFMLQSHDFVHRFFKDSPANFSLLVAIFACFICYIFLFHTVIGYEIRMSGKNENAARLSGIEPRKTKILAMTLAGAFAGCVFLNDILGSSGKYTLGFSPDYGFVGIAVALLARNNPLGILISAFLFGILQKGASDLDVETEFITRDFARVIQAILIFSVAGTYFFDLKNFKRKRK